VETIPDGQTESPAPDPLEGDPRVVAYLGDAYPVIARFHGMLTSQGVLRG